MQPVLDRPRVESSNQLIIDKKQASAYGNRARKGHRKFRASAYRCAGRGYRYPRPFIRRHVDRGHGVISSVDQLRGEWLKADLSFSDRSEYDKLVKLLEGLQIQLKILRSPAGG
jgi:hypothetical protein